jgi:hypothetical protein
MTESVRQRKRLEEASFQSSNDDSNRGLVMDQDDRRSRRQSSIPLS